MSRVIVGGTIDESGLDTIGVAQYIDPGNYGLRGPGRGAARRAQRPTPRGPASLNTYLTDASDRVAFVSQAVGNVMAHEIGHMIGNYHTDNASRGDRARWTPAARASTNLFGVGPDGVGGTADDTDVDFVTDIYSQAEGFTGLEDTLNDSAWAYVFR